MDEYTFTVGTPDFVAKSIPLKTRQQFQSRLSEWFRTNSRDFQWRHAHSPYKILIAEILLQKTNSRMVGEVYESFINQYPTPYDVKKSSVEEIREIISPLGLIYRAERLHVICNAIVDDFGGNVPNNLSELMGFKGIGRYAASAILIFGFKRSLALVDSNIIRILSRVFNIESRNLRPHTDLTLWEAAQTLVPFGDAANYNLALLDFSALICQLKPNCIICPLIDICKSYPELWNC